MRKKKGRGDIMRTTNIFKNQRERMSVMKKTSLKTAGIVAFFVLTMVAASTVKADLVPVPTGLNPGDQYRLIFTTSTTTDASDSTAAYYNNFVDNLANSVTELQALGVTWKAAANLNGADPRVNTGTTGSDAIPTYRTDGVLFAASYTALWEQKATQRLLVDENANAVPNSPQAHAWTGIYIEAGGVPSWRASDYLGNGSTSTYRGAPDDLTYFWGRWTDSTTTQNHLYALSDVITVIPEPASGLLLIAGAFGLGMLRKKLHG
jgi:hypothetical protein